MNICICIAAYNRVDALNRLLQCLAQIPIYESITIDLVLSIDYSNLQNEVEDCIKNFEWVHGKTNVVKHSKNIGLKNHILKCGSFSFEYDCLVLLEDDLIISPFFIPYLIESIKICREDKFIAGISLYSYKKNEGDKMDFNCYIDEFDNYYLQFPSSWGLAFTPEQWSKFQSWFFDNDCDYFLDDSVPKYVRDWSKSSWKKHFVRYLTNTSTYFLYPRFSLSSNPGVDGTHHNSLGSLYSVPICTAPRKWYLSKINRSRAVYDVNFENIFARSLVNETLYDSGLSLGDLTRKDKNVHIVESYFITLNDLLKINFLSFVVIFKKLLKKIKKKL